MKNLIAALCLAAIALATVPTPAQADRYDSRYQQNHRHHGNNGNLRSYENRHGYFSHDHKKWNRNNNNQISRRNGHRNY